MPPRFEAARVQRCTAAKPLLTVADRRDGEVYVYHESDICLAVNVALITGRPLLISGPSGSGKSSLALNVALSMGRRYYELVITNRSEAHDLLYSIDNIRRLNDAQVNELKPLEAYVEPGVLWWAFDGASARWRGQQDCIEENLCATDPNRGAAGSDAVVLIDEIDKADPDLPNSLLVPLGSMQFPVPPTGFTVRGASSPLIVITTNNERELPDAFLRRCITYELPSPGPETLVEIALAVDATANYDRELLTTVADYVVAMDQGPASEKRVVSTAEFLDTVRACAELGLSPGDADFDRLTRVTLARRRYSE